MMDSAPVWIAAIAALCAALFAFLVWLRAGRPQDDGAAERFNRIDAANERLERELRREIAEAGQGNRQELSHSVAQFQQTLGQQMATIATVQNNQIDGFAQQLVKLTDANEVRLNGLQKAIWAIVGLVWGIGPILYILVGDGALW